MEKAAFCMGYWAKLVIQYFSQESTAWVNTDQVFIIPVAYSFTTLVLFNTCM